MFARDPWAKARIAPVKATAMRMILSCLLVATSLSGCVGEGLYGRPGDSNRYDYNRPDPAYGSYEADRYHRGDNRHQEDRTLSRDERVYRGKDGRYYCRRSDGTTGLIVGAIAGGALGNIIAPGGSELLGTILGAGAGALAGQAIDQNAVHCR